jgi:hypothetical protein
MIESRGPDVRGREDEWLVVRCQLGERPAFDELIQRWHEPLWKYVRRQRLGPRSGSLPPFASQGPPLGRGRRGWAWIRRPEKECASRGILWQAPRESGGFARLPYGVPGDIMNSPTNASTAAR